MLCSQTRCCVPDPLPMHARLWIANFKLQIISICVVYLHQAGLVPHKHCLDAFTCNDDESGGKANLTGSLAINCHNAKLNILLPGRKLKQCYRL